MDPVLPGEVENAAALELVRWWAEIDPAAAIRFAASRPEVHGRSTLSAELWGVWHDRAGRKALAWLDALEPGVVRAQILPTVVSRLAATLPQEALRLAGELSGEPRHSALAALFAAWSAVNPPLAIEHALGLADARERTLTLRQALGGWLERDLDAAVAWARRLPPSPGPDSLDVLPPVTAVLVEKWAARAPADAATFVLKSSDGAGRSRLLRTVAEQWAAADSTAALAFATVAANAADRAVLVRGVVGAVVQSSPPAAAALALTLPADDVGRQALGLVIDHWVAREPAGLATWATSLLATPRANEAIASVVTAWAGADLAAAGQWLNGLPAGDQRDAGCAALVIALAPRQPALAAEWAGRIANPRLRPPPIDASRR
ncbi:hypothetical protein [Horticoccus sp. 23ND18S-11]|uniref:hypothetical protein n=1 Tax=Horticoccus sp. 23ND18S-11 TaxID=3391832 RepID=UPI0039C9066B